MNQRLLAQNHQCVIRQRMVQGNKFWVRTQSGEEPEPWSCPGSFCGVNSLTRQVNQRISLFTIWSKRSTTKETLFFWTAATRLLSNSPRSVSQRPHVSQDDISSQNLQVCKATCLFSTVQFEHSGKQTSRMWWVGCLVWLLFFLNSPVWHTHTHLQMVGSHHKCACVHSYTHRPWFLRWRIEEGSMWYWDAEMIGYTHGWKAKFSTISFSGIHTINHSISCVCVCVCVTTYEIKGQDVIVTVSVQQSSKLCHQTKFACIATLTSQRKKPQKSWFI